MKKLALAGAVLGAGLVTTLVVHKNSQAADHLDAPGTAAMPMADINDVYAWMNEDASKVNLIMTVSPGDPGTRTFGPTIQYTFHVTAKTSDANMGYGIGGHTGTETKVTCVFASNTSVQCWVGNKDYVTGDPSNVAGLSSASGKIKVFAGRRSDPFFFNLQGFRNAVSIIEGAAGGLTFDAAGCPAIDAGTSAALIAKLKEPTHTPTAAPCPATGTDCFDTLNVMAISMQVDKTLLIDGTNTTLAVWASTNAAP